MSSPSLYFTLNIIVQDSRKKSGTIVVSIAEDSDSDSFKRVTRNGHVKERKELKHAESDNDNSDDSDFIPTKKAKVSVTLNQNI